MGLSREEQLALRERVIDSIHTDITNFKLVFKEDDSKHRRISRLVARLPRRGLINFIWKKWLEFNTTLYPKVYIDSREEWEANIINKAAMLQHEHVHCKDAETFFGMFPKRTRLMNVALFYIVYLMPQLLAVFALLTPVMGPWALMALLFLAPIPSPGRMIAEMRAYRRTRELGGDIDGLTRAFTTLKYWYMWPFKRHVRRMLLKPSPYKDQMDKVWYG